MRHIFLLSFLLTTSCINYPSHWRNNPNYRYVPPYINNNYKPQMPRPYSYSPPMQRNYGYYAGDYDSQYREPYRTYQINESRQQFYYPYVDNDESYYYNYPPRNIYNNPNYYSNGYQNNYQNQPAIDNDYEVAR